MAGRGKPEGPPLVTVASYNIRKAVGADLRRRPSRILDVLDEIAPDIAVIQEADRRFGERASALPTDALAGRGRSSTAALPVPGSAPRRAAPRPDRGIEIIRGDISSHSGSR